MTISPNTAAESALLAHFSELMQQEIFNDHQDSNNFLPTLSERNTAIAQIESNGLPIRKIESWHYTDLRSILTHIAPLTSNDTGNILSPVVESAEVLPIVNGVVKSQQNMNATEIFATPLTKNKQAETVFSLVEAEEKFDKGNAVGDINTAFATDGWHIDVAANSQKNHVIEIQNILNGGQSHSRLPVHVGENARITIIERETGDDSESFSSLISQLKIAKGAEVNWIIIRDRGLSATELNRFSALLEENSKLTLYIVNAGVKLLRQEVNVDLAGENADFQLRGINLLSGKSHTDTTMVVRHLVENTTSSEVFRNVVAEEAKGVFQGIIRVAQIAQKTDAKMACNSLILSDKAEFNAKPELEIFADDVACGHGATVAEIDHDHLFYLMARGIPEPQARSLLVKAFVNELIEELPENLSETLHQTLENWLTNHFYAS